MISRFSFRLLVAGLAVSMVAALSAFAQPEGASPKANPTAPSHLSVGNHELKRFAGALADLQNVQIRYEKRINRAFTSSPLSQKRYYQIYNAKERGVQIKPRATATERVEFKELSTKITRLQQRAENEMVQAVHDKGFKVARFNQIVEALHTQPSLVKRLEAVEGHS